MSILVRFVVMLIVVICGFTSGCAPKEEPDYDVIAPKFFTPNGDGNNDLFEVMTKDGRPVSLEIYTRAGVLVFAIEAVRCQWDGYSLSGQKMPEGVYFYNAEIVGSQPLITRSGFVHLHR